MRQPIGPLEPGVTGRLRKMRAKVIDGTPLAELLDEAIAAIIEARTKAMKFRTMYRDDPDLKGPSGHYYTPAHRLPWESPE